ncbi:MAG TPA: NADP-dependent oxidoreductase [Phenylobacterium sp.]|nr:NADP-dependent oxidoreductase [Phenylobacterium sp.]
MDTPINRRWILARRPVGRIEESNFQRADAPIPEPADGEFLVRITHLSFDPTQRGWLTTDTYVPAIPIGEVVRAKAVGQVVRSRHPGFPVGRMVQGGFGWQEYALTSGQTDLMAVTEIPGGATPEEALGLFGLTGMTAYFGLNEIGRPQPGDTVLVSAAAGGTGSVAVQLAKAAGCHVIGIAGGPEKCAWVTGVAGADACIDYKAQNVWRELGRLAPEGVDVVFENVGGAMLEAAIMRLAQGGRIVLSGMISSYEGDPHAQKGVRYLLNLCMKRASIRGFIVLDYESRFAEATRALQALAAAGKLVGAADVQAGFDNIPATLNRLFDGRNLGKQLLKVADPPLPVV